MAGFWKAIAKGLLAVGKGAVKGALWASQHPEILQAVVAIAASAQQPQQGTQK